MTINLYGDLAGTLKIAPAADKARGREQEYDFKQIKLVAGIGERGFNPKAG